MRSKLISRLLTVVSVSSLLIAGSAVSASTPSSLMQVFDPEMIGADIAYFERVTGPARNTWDETKVYKVDGCEVMATTANGTVRSLRIELSTSCTFDLNVFLPNYAGRFPSLHAMTFGEFDDVTGANGQFFADCLNQCGNAADPVIYEHWYGSRADLVLEVMLEAVQVSGAALDAADEWQAAMESAEGEDWVTDAKFNCTRNYDGVARQSFRNVAISAITIGYDIAHPRCNY